MDISIPSELKREIEKFKKFLQLEVERDIATWYKDREVPRQFFLAMAAGGWFGFKFEQGRLSKPSMLRQALLMEQLAILSPGLAVATLVHTDLGLMGLYLFGSRYLTETYGAAAVSGKRLLCLGNTESKAGSDAAGIEARVEKVTNGWLLTGTKAYVTGGTIGDMALITAVSHPAASRTERISMFLVDLSAKGVTRKKLNKQVWIPSDLTRIMFSDVFIPEDHLVGKPGKGLQQLLSIFTHSRVVISALTLGTAVGAFQLALEHGQKRLIFTRKILDHQAKAFELADFYARIEAARLMLFKACLKVDAGEDFRLEASMAKYLNVAVAKEVTSWAADLFGAASVMFESPIHKYPLDAWAAALGEGTQDVQKLIIFREIVSGRA